MGTNFYLRPHRGNDDPQYHVGKRSAAGLYCWHCRVTLCKDGSFGIHSGISEWLDSCPKCGCKKQEEPLEKSAAGRELGFNKSKPGPKRGVCSVSSFSWAMRREDLEKYTKGLAKSPRGQCPRCNRALPSPGSPIEDEYGHTYSWLEFLRMLRECPIQYTTSVGQWFS